MLFFVGRGQASTLILVTVVLASAACASRMPIAVPGYQPVPTVEAQPDLQKETPTAKPRTRPASPKPTLSPAKAAHSPRKAARSPAKPARPPAVRLDSAALELAVTRRHAHGPLALALARRTGNPEMADRAASAVVREAERLRLSPSLLAAVLLIENAPLDSVAVSNQGAIGMMQIMPVHLGSFGCEADLVNVESNICHGARLLKQLVQRTGSVPVALRRYNGCVRGKNTPRCHRYPTRVLRTASRLRREVLVAAGTDSATVVGEALGMRSQTEAAAIPSPPVAADSVTPPAGDGTAQCATLVGCLRYRWTLAN
jgi:soluble lytic murein transglycosylase-like protein